MSSSERINIITKYGFTVCTPKNISLMTPYIFLEQEAWFEDEVNILPRLIAPNCSALDVGANHGVYTLAIANYIKQSEFGGRVHAFEPNKALHPLIMASVRENKLLDYVSLREEGLSNRSGHATFYIPENPELASLDYFEGAREVTVPVTTLNDLNISLPEGERIGLIKLDAEGAELDILAGGKDFFNEHQPIIMFEIKHGNTVNLGLTSAFIDMGYSVFKTLGELGLLVPFDDTQPLDSYQLNLIACSPRETQRLMKAGIVLQEVFDASSPKELYSEFTTPSFGLLVDENSLNDTLRNAVMHLKASLNPSLEAGVRWSHASSAIHNLLSLDDASKRMDVDFALARLYSMVGQRQEAVKTLQRLLADINQFGLSEIRWRVSCHPNYDQQPVNDDIFGWQRCSAYEALIHLSSYSGYFNNNQMGLLKKIYNEPHHSIDMERRLALMLLRKGAKISIGSESKLCTDAHLNDKIWKDIRTNDFLFKDHVIETKQLANNAAVIAKAAASDVDGRRICFPVWLQGYVTDTLSRNLGILDIGAMMLENSRKEYQSLLDWGLARVIGFEPVEVECQKLNDTYIHQDVCFLPYFIGNGRHQQFRLNRSSMTSSLYESDRTLLEKFANLWDLCETVQMIPVETTRLDDIKEISFPIDFIKIDIQGAELQAFQGGEKCLSDTTVIQTEVEWIPLYKDQPLFSEVESYLRTQGFVFHKVLGFGSRPFKPFEGFRGSQCLWSDVIFVKDFNKLDCLNNRQLLNYAIIMHSVFKSYDLAHLILEEYCVRHGLADLSQAYRFLYDKMD